MAAAALVVVVSAPPDDDARFNIGLVADVMGVLRQHGYVQTETDIAKRTADFLVNLRALVLEFEGKKP